MLGLDDRVAIREPAVREHPSNKSAGEKKEDWPEDKKDAKAKPDGKPSGEKPLAKPGRRNHGDGSRIVVQTKQPATGMHPPWVMGPEQRRPLAERPP